MDESSQIIPAGRPVDLEICSWKNLARESVESVWGMEQPAWKKFGTWSRGVPTFCVKRSHREEKLSVVKSSNQEVTNMAMLEDWRNALKVVGSVMMVNHAMTDSVGDWGCHLGLPLS